MKTFSGLGFVVFFIAELLPGSRYDNNRLHRKMD